jgi:hypothetical protein
LFISFFLLKHSAVDRFCTKCTYIALWFIYQGGQGAFEIRCSPSHTALYHKGTCSSNGSNACTLTPLCLTLISLMKTHESQACCLFRGNTTAVATVQ